MWSEFRVEAEDFRDLGDVVLVTGRVKASGARSGVGLDRSWALAFRLREGKIVWQHNFTEEALEAVRLPQ
jgi:ketosteroid isomerase-like protein